MPFVERADAQNADNYRPDRSQRQIPGFYVPDCNIQKADANGDYYRLSMTVSNTTDATIDAAPVMIYGNAYEQAQIYLKVQYPLADRFFPKRHLSYSRIIRPDMPHPDRAVCTLTAVAVRKESKAQGVGAQSSAAENHIGAKYYFGRGVPQDYAKALHWYQLAAAQGYAAAQYNMGTMYDDGRGVPQDYAKALHWYQLAAAQGHADAEINIGFMHEKGHGVPQDYVKALHWYRLAAAQGDADAAAAVKRLQQILRK